MRSWDIPIFSDFDSCPAKNDEKKKNIRPISEKTGYCGLFESQVFGSLGLGHRAHELQDALQVCTVSQLQEKRLTREDCNNAWRVSVRVDPCRSVSFWFWWNCGVDCDVFCSSEKMARASGRESFRKGSILRKLGVRVGVGSIQPIIPLLLDTFSKYQRRCTEGFRTALRQIDEECAETTTPTRLKRNKIKFQTNPNDELEEGTPRITKLQLMMPKRNWNQQSKRTLDIGASYGRTLTTACGPWLCYQRVNIDGFGVSSWNCNLSESE